MKYVILALLILLPLLWLLWVLVNDRDPEWEEHCAAVYPELSYEECRKVSGPGGW